jgi:DNA polymerase-4
LIAKMGSELNKPDGLTVIPPGREADTLAPMPIRRLPGVGPATQARLLKRGIDTIGQLARASPTDLVDMLGQAHGAVLHQYSQGIDQRSVIPERDAKSVSAEETFPIDLTGQRELAQHIRRLAERVTARLIAEGSSGRTVTLKLRHYDFSTITRSVTLGQPTNSTAKIVAAATQLLAAVDTSDGVRLVGVGVSGLSEYSQQDLLTWPEPEPTTEDRATAPVQELADPPETTPPQSQHWTPGQDVAHEHFGCGWVQGSGIGRVTVRFEGPHTAPGPIKTFLVEDPALAAACPPVW